MVEMVVINCNGGRSINKEKLVHENSVVGWPVGHSCCLGVYFLASPCIPPLHPTVSRTSIFFLKSERALLNTGHKVTMFYSEKNLQHFEQLK